MPTTDIKSSAKLAPTMPIQFRTFCDEAVLNVGSLWSNETRHRKTRTANASSATARISFAREAFALGTVRFFNSVAPSSRQKFIPSSSYVFLHVGQIFIRAAGDVFG